MKKRKIRHLSYFFLLIIYSNLYLKTFNLMIQILKISYYLIPVLVLFGMCFYISFQKLKKNENERIQHLYTEILLEEQMAHQFKIVSERTNILNNSIEQKLLKIKVSIFNIDFSLSEIFN
ncbi:MAG: hypothetical protein ACKVIG_05495 [Flavobacteriales bacterium]|jgi:hypothetical protein